MELGGDANYHVKELGSISFHMYLGEVFDLDNILCVPNLTKRLFSISYMTSMVFG